MYIYFDSNGYVYGYGSEYEKLSAEVDFVPEEVDRYLGAYKYIDGTFVADEGKKAKLDDIRTLESELMYLEQWFKNYDAQAVKYQRCQRLGIECNIDIESLDAQAVTGADRIKEIRSRLSALFSDINHI